MKRVLPFIIIVLVAALTVSGAMLLYQSKIKNAGATSAVQKKEKAETGDVHARGNPNAAVTIEEFGDYQCPSCANISAVLHKLEGEFPGRLRVVFRNFPLAMHKYSMEAAMAAEAAAKQGHFWAMHDLLYANQNDWAHSLDVKPIFADYATRAGLDLEKFKADSESKEVRERVETDRKMGNSLKVTLTPTLFLNGRPLPSSDLGYEPLREEIEKALGEGEKGEKEEKH